MDEKVFSRETALHKLPVAVLVCASKDTASENAAVISKTSCLHLL